MHVGPVLREVSLPSLKVPGASFPEEVVAFGVERTSFVESADVGHAFLHGPAAFEDQGPIAVLGEQIACEQAGRTGADDHGPMLQRLRAGFGPLRTGREHTAESPDRCRASTWRASRRARRPPSRK